MFFSFFDGMDALSTVLNRQAWTIVEEMVYMVLVSQCLRNFGVDEKFLSGREMKKVDKVGVCACVR